MRKYQNIECTTPLSHIEVLTDIWALAMEELRSKVRW